MITNIKNLEKYCIDYTKIENYDTAIKSQLRYDCHHRLEIDEMQSAKDLIFLHLYYNRPPEELVFLEHGEHMRLHNKGKNLSAETRQKMSKALKGENNPMFGKNMSTDTRQKMSEAHKGKHWHLSAESRKKISEAKKGKPSPNRGKPGTCLGKHWHLENGHRIYTE